jgi:hypothetical protein
MPMRGFNVGGGLSEYLLVGLVVVYQKVRCLFFCFMAVASFIAAAVYC